MGNSSSFNVTNSGIPIKPVYSREDIDNGAGKLIELPGEFPYTRGLESGPYPFMQNQFFGLGTAKETRERADFLKRIGCSHVVGKGMDEIEGNMNMPQLIATDLITQRGRDPDEPESRGRVGGVGVSISTMDDIAILLDGDDIAKTYLQINAFDGVLPVLALCCAYCLDVRKEPLRSMCLAVLSAHTLSWCHDHIGFPPKAALKLETEIAKFSHDSLAAGTYIGFSDGYDQGEAGSNAVQEIAFAISRQILLMEEGIKVGLDPDELARGYFGHHRLDMDFFESIAKIRVLRKIWAETMKGRFGCKNEASLKFKMFINETAGTELYANEALNNIVRLTMMTLAGVLSGSDGFFTAAYDEPLGIPSEDAAKMSVRIQQIVALETGVMKVADPLGGSYYLEYLTDRIHGKVRELLTTIEKNGGFMKCWESGWVRAEIAKSANERQKNIETGEKVVIGVNKFRLDQKQQVPSFRVSAESEVQAVERVKEFKAKRDYSQTEKALTNLRQKAERIENHWPESCGELMPSMIEAARAHATLGEMHKIMRDVFGYSHYIGQGF